VSNTAAQVSNKPPVSSSAVPPPSVYQPSPVSNSAAQDAIPERPNLEAMKNAITKSQMKVGAPV